MKSHQRGFIPLVAIILLGITVVIGGAAATMSIRSSDQKENSLHNPSVDTISTTSESLEVKAVSAAIDTSGPNVEAKTANKQIQTTSDLSDTTHKICEDARIQNNEQNKFILEINTLCDQLLNGEIESHYVSVKESSLREKWKLWEYSSKRGIDETESNGKDNFVVQSPSITKNELENYAESTTYPIILKFADNHGNINKKSQYNAYEGNNSLPTNVVLRIGDTISAKIEAKDPKGRQLEYNWNASSQNFNDEVGRGRYTSSNTLNYTLTEEDLKSSGETFRLAYQVRVSGGEYYRFGGGEYDDAGFIDYTLQQ